MRTGFLSVGIIASLCAFAVLFGLQRNNGEPRRSQDYIAVSSNFVPVAEKLQIEFQKASGHQVQLVPGSTGKLYAQIVNGAPYAAFLSADRAHVERLEKDGYGVKGSRFTYGFGALVLWGSVDGQVGEAALMHPDLHKLAIANPQIAPYGQAARDTLARLDPDGTLDEKIVYGDNVGQAFGFISTGNAELGLVALSQVIMAGKPESDYWRVPDVYYAPIAQDGMQLTDSAAATLFMDFIKSDAGRSIIENSGYAVSPL